MTEKIKLSSFVHKIDQDGGLSKIKKLGKKCWWMPIYIVWVDLAKTIVGDCLYA